MPALSRLSLAMCPRSAAFARLSPFFSTDPTTTEIYTLSLHDALPICVLRAAPRGRHGTCALWAGGGAGRSEEHTSELQSPMYLVCRLLLEKKKIDPHIDNAQDRHAS